MGFEVGEGVGAMEVGGPVGNGVVGAAVVGGDVGEAVVGAADVGAGVGHAQQLYSA